MSAQDSPSVPEDTKSDASTLTQPAAAAVVPRAPNALQEDPTVIEDDATFPLPELYFRVFDSEKDEPDAKIKQDVFKLYERWQEKTGRRWPENGLQTEDMVWLAEEAYKKPGDRGPTRSQALAAGDVVLGEESEFQHQFISESEDTMAAIADNAAAADAPGGSGTSTSITTTAKGKAGSVRSGARPAGAAGGNRLPRTSMSNYEKTVEGGVWVTDEYESADIEAGNMELLWNQYLFDEEGKPIFFARKAGDKGQPGDEGEDWADIYGSYRPRHVNSEDAREALWVTDEFESEEDNTESEWDPEYVGAGLGLRREDPINPQYSLRHSVHPLAPFPGEALKWASYVYPDGTTYEGLTRQSVAHGMGVMTFGQGTAGGFSFQDTRNGDKYEGEFQGGYAHGLGQFTSETSGEIFIGEFFAGQKHGCGIKVDMSSYYQLLERGSTPVDAYAATFKPIMANIEFRTWYHNKALGDDYEDETVLKAVMDDFDNPLSVVLRSKEHDMKLKEWKSMTPQQKAASRVNTIVSRVQAARTQRPPYYFDHKGELKAYVDSEGNDTDYDSVDMLVGNTTDGGYGLGWDGAVDSDEFPRDARMQAKMSLEANQDRQAEDNMKETAFGKKMLNPFNGLDVKMYLDGKEGKYKDLALLSQLNSHGQFDPTMDLPPGAAYNLDMRLPGGDSSEKEFQTARVMQALNVDFDKATSMVNEMQKYDREQIEDDPFAPAQKEMRDRDYGGGENTDTRFETESDQMELCDLAEILGTVEEARQIVNRARLWRWKPYGEATMQKLQDGTGAPVNTMQDPIHYPHGTKFMAPGPMGQCHPLPNDVAILSEMNKVAHNYQTLHNMYNFDWDPEPGSVQHMIDQRIIRSQELRKNQLGRYMEAAEEELGDMDDAEMMMQQQSAQQQQPQAAMMASLSLARLVGVPMNVAMAASHTSSSSSSSSAPVMRLTAPGSRPFWGTSHPPMASMSMGMGHASRVLLNAFQSAARAVPTHSTRPRLQRPTKGSDGKQ